MSSFQIVDKQGMYPYVMFAGGYKCDVSSVVKACKATELEIYGIAGVTKHMYCTRVYPQGRFCCGKCSEWKVLDMNNWAWAIRSSYGECPLVCPKLVCEDCSESEDFSEGCRFAILSHEDFYVSMRNDAKKVWTRKFAHKWQVNAKRRKQHREFALKSAMVFQSMFEDRHESWQDIWSVFIMHT